MEGGGLGSNIGPEEQQKGGSSGAICQILSYRVALSVWVDSVLSLTPLKPGSPVEGYNKQVRVSKFSRIEEMSLVLIRNAQCII